MTGPATTSHVLTRYNVTCRYCSEKIAVDDKDDRRLKKNAGDYYSILKHINDLLCCLIFMTARYAVIADKIGTIVVPNHERLISSLSMITFVDSQLSVLWPRDALI